MLSVRTALSGFFVIAVVWPAAAQEKNEKIQALNVDLGFVNASGNTSVTTINLGDKFVVNSPDKRVIFSQTFNAVRSQTDGTKNAENYRGQLRLDYGLGGKFYLFGITGWDRNVFAGVARRFEETVGLPYQALALPNDDLTLLGVYDNLPGLLPAPAPTGARFKKTDRFLTAGLVAQATGLVGRWDLTFGVDQTRYSSWFEVVRDGEGWQGRFLGRCCHPTPIGSITMTEDRFSFSWPNEEHPDAPATRFEGRVLGANQLSGVMIPAKGPREAFQGIRAPLLERFRAPRWGRPIDLLADGLKGWVVREPATSNGWRLDNGVLSNTPPSADLMSRQRFGDFRLHVEVNVPPSGNSGIYLRGRHEIQVQDDYAAAPHPRRMGGVYGQVTPTSLPAKRAGEWQAFDITLIGRVVTVVLNGVTIIDQVEIPGITGGAIDSDEGAPGPIMLQGDHTGVRYRNLRIEPAVEAGGPIGAAIVQAERDRFRAQVARDTAALRNLLDDDLVYIHSNALIENKAHFIETVGTGRIVYDSLVPVYMTHRLYGSTAVGNGRVRAVVRMNGQPPLSVGLLFTTVLLQRNGRWRLASWQSTRAQP